MRFCGIFIVCILRNAVDGVPYGIHKTSMIFFVGSGDLDAPFLRQELICDSAGASPCPTGLMIVI